MIYYAIFTTDSLGNYILCHINKEQFVFNQNEMRDILMQYFDLKESECNIDIGKYIGYYKGYYVMNLSQKVEYSEIYDIKKGTKSQNLTFPFTEKYEELKEIVDKTRIYLRDVLIDDLLEE